LGSTGIGSDNGSDNELSLHRRNGSKIRRIGDSGTQPLEAASYIWEQEIKHSLINSRLLVCRLQQLLKR
jgi:hypothetical protein